MSWTPTSFHRFWFALLSLLLLMEGIAIYRHGDGDTLSEWTWSKLHNWPTRVLLGAVLVWLCWHFLWWGPTKGMTWRDAVAVFLGAAMGLCSFLWAVRA